MDRIRIVKVFGERNTGTRALSALLRQVPGLRQRLATAASLPRCDAAVQAAIETQMRGHWKRLYLHAMRDDIAARFRGDDPWKHALPRLTPGMEAARAGTLLMVRNPYSWLIGLARRPYHIKGPNADTLEGFAARPWMTERREGLPAILASPVELWTLKTRGALDCRAQAARRGLAAEIVRFEDFVQDPITVATRALASLGIAADRLVACDQNTKPQESPLCVLQDYYRAERWRSRLSRDTVRRVNALVDWDAAERLGYARLDPDDYPDSLPDPVREEIRVEMASLAAPSHRETGTAAAT